VEAEWKRTAAYVVCRDATDRLLLTRFVMEGHPDSGRWTLPGGGMEWGESPRDTASRELEEETGFTATIGSVLGVFSQWFTAEESVQGAAGHFVGIVFEAQDLAGELRVDFDGGTTDLAQWFTLDEVRALPHVAQVDFVLDLI